jgi:linoleoyl-CoA desaturase
MIALSIDDRAEQPVALTEPDQAFHAELRRRVGAQFSGERRAAASRSPEPFRFRAASLPLEPMASRTRGTAEAHRKTAILVTWLTLSYFLLVFVAGGPWTAALAAVSVGLAMAGIGFNVMHDGGHGSYSPNPRVNRLMARSLDLLGGSSYVWHRKHNLLHHTWPNVPGLDDDIETGGLARLSVQQPRKAYHRFQWLYLWPLYGFLAVKWQLFDDFAFLVKQRVGERRFPRPRGGDLAVFVGGKIAFFTWAFAIPLLRHPLSVVLVTYFGCAFVLGLTLSVVFQLAHCVPEAAAGPADERSWARRQVESSVDFARGHRLITWYLGGLNFQIEHHLFPQIAHVHYPAIAPIVESVCSEFGVRYSAYPTLRQAVRAHVRFLRQLGSSPAAL